MSNKPTVTKWTNDQAKCAQVIASNIPVLEVPTGMAGNEFIWRVLQLAGDISVAGVGIDPAGVARVAVVRGAMEAAARAVTRQAPKIISAAAARRAKDSVTNEVLDQLIRKHAKGAATIREIHQRVRAAVISRKRLPADDRPGVGWRRIRQRIEALGGLRKLLGDQ